MSNTYNTQDSNKDLTSSTGTSNLNIDQSTDTQTTGGFHDSGRTHIERGSAAGNIDGDFGTSGLDHNSGPGPGDLGPSVIGQKGGSGNLGANSGMDSAVRFDGGTGEGMGAGTVGARDPGAGGVPLNGETGEGMGADIGTGTGGVGYGPGKTTSSSNKYGPGADDLSSSDQHGGTSDIHGAKPSMGDKIIGGAEKLVGKATKNPEMVEKGQERKERV
ncbi:hypothetical protein C8F04DRAFT_415423 [Mycena alexandri]|uniref:Uncharacterized protein n=1 Tax=Mycena alexandri TaxID=1745969 RepID=A0AAD6WMF0_9AGAR|nr:hypothetical protein C8F04DRAFT_415423 [Mycena alexandri]